MIIYSYRVRLYSKKGLTLIESLISIILVATLLVSVLGAFYISKLGTSRARHRITAMSAIKQYMEPELRAGFEGGAADEPNDSYVMVDAADPIAITIDDRGTASPADDLMGALTPSPYPATLTTVGEVPNQWQYKTIGYVATWNEDRPSGGPVIQCSERAVTDVSLHN